MNANFWFHGSNESRSETIRVVLIDGDGTVDVSDLFDLSKAYVCDSFKPNWNPNCDFNGDGKIDASDLFELSKNYGKAM
jgi:Ca2+-binding EF-hand superfamily protein